MYVLDPYGDYLDEVSDEDEESGDTNEENANVSSAPQYELSENAKWFVGTIDGNKVVFKTQYFGIDEEDRGYQFMMPVTFTPIDDEEDDFKFSPVKAEELVMTYDAEKKLLTPEKENTGFVVNEGNKEIYFYNAYVNPVYKYVEEVAAKPKAPYNTSILESEEDDPIFAFYIPNTGENEEILFPEKLFYNIFFDTPEKPYTFETDVYGGLDEAMTDIPFGFTDEYDFVYIKPLLHGFYIYQESYDRIGVQSVYTGGGEVRKSEIVWTNSTDIKNAENSRAVSTVYYDLQGRKLVKPVSGINIVKKTYLDGTVKITKVIKK